ncbi:MAG: hypothetical protein R3E66_22130 [bacterium]
MGPSRHRERYAPVDADQPSGSTVLAHNQSPSRRAIGCPAQTCRSLLQKPRALTDDEIEELSPRGVNAANVAKNAGFTGVQIHSAHGYLNSQFLSPITNQRTDKWGGSLENRARFLLTIVERTREAVGPNFPVCVKLNSSDFQKGGFSDEDAATVAGWLEQRGIDLLEISGGTYENVAFLDTEARPSAREAYFLEYANIIRAAAPNVPLMITGGFRTPKFMESTLAGGDVDVIGLGRPFCVAPNFPNALRAGDLHKLPTPEFDIQIGSGFWGHRSTSATLRGLNSQAGTAWFYEQIYRLADGEAPHMRPGSAIGVLSRHFQREFKMAKRRKHNT